MAEKPKHRVDKTQKRSIDSLGNPVAGSWDIEFNTDVGSGSSTALERGKYTFLLDFGTTALDGSEDAYQLSGDLIIGKYPIINVEPIIIPWNNKTNPLIDPILTFEDDITPYYKKNTSFDIKIKTLNPDTKETGIQNLPLEFYFRRGSLKNYGENNTEEMWDDIKHSVNIPERPSVTTIGKDTLKKDGSKYPVEEYGNAYINNVKVSDIFPYSDEIQTLNTLLVACRGTTDRAENDNYMPYVVAVPLVLGTRHVYLKIRGLSDNKYRGTPYVCGVKGGGSIAFTVNTYEAFAIDGNQSDSSKIVAKFGLYDWISKPEKYVHEGYYTVQEKKNGVWVDMPSNLLSTVEGDDQTVLEGNKFRHASNSTKQIQIIVSNDKPLDYEGSMQIRLYYHGVIGTYYDNPTDEWNIEVKPSNKTYNSVAMYIFMENAPDDMSLLFNQPFDFDTEILTQTGSNCGLDGVLILEIEKKE